MYDDYLKRVHDPDRPAPKRMRARYSKDKDAVSDVWHYRFYGEDFTCTITLHYNQGFLWTAKIECMKNLEHLQILGGRYTIKQEPGNSTREEFELAMQTAVKFIQDNLLSTNHE